MRLKKVKKILTISEKKKKGAKHWAPSSGGSAALRQRRSTESSPPRPFSLCGPMALRAEGRRGGMGSPSEDRSADRGSIHSWRAL